VAVFTESGNLLQTIIGGELAAPWGVALAPASFGEFGGDLLVGNFSFVASEINAFNPTTGAFLGTIPVDPGSGNTPGGLWSLEFGIGGMNGDPNTLYFTAGSTARRTGCSRRLCSGGPRAEHSGAPRCRAAELGALRWRRSRGLVGVPQGLAWRQPGASFPVKIEKRNQGDSN